MYSFIVILLYFTIANSYPKCSYSIESEHKTTSIPVINYYIAPIFLYS